MRDPASHDVARVLLDEWWAGVTMPASLSAEVAGTIRAELERSLVAWAHEEQRRLRVRIDVRPQHVEQPGERQGGRRRRVRQRPGGWGWAVTQSARR